MTFWRAPTDNDRPSDLGVWTRYGLDVMTEQVRSVTQGSTEDGAMRIVAKSWISPPVLGWGFETTTIYSLYGEGTLKIQTHATPKGSLPKSLPRVGLEMKIPSQLSRVEWYGRGPGESYRDKKEAGKIGVWSSSIDELNFIYDVPQENGNRSGVRWVTVKDEAGSGIQASLVQLGGNDASEGFDFAVQKYTAKQLEEASHPCDLKDNEYIVFRLDAEHRALGTGSCGPGVLDKYELRPRTFEFEVELKAVTI